MNTKNKDPKTVTLILLLGFEKQEFEVPIFWGGNHYTYFEHHYVYELNDKEEIIYYPYKLFGVQIGFYHYDQNGHLLSELSFDEVREKISLAKMNLRKKETKTFSEWLTFLNNKNAR